MVNLGKLNISAFDYSHKNAEDDYLPLMERILQHDPIILATPVYWYSMSAIMKIFIDRLSDCIIIRKDIGRRLAGKSLYVLASYSTTLPDGFEATFRQTCEYMAMHYGGCFFHYAGKDEALLAKNDNLAIFNQNISGLIWGV